MAITIKNEEQIEKMRRAGQMLARVHAELARELKEGMTTKDVDRLVEEMILSFGGQPNFKNYNGFPAAACVSLNDEVVHGIPSDKRFLRDGDIITIDTGVLLEGYHSDAARTHAIGNVTDEARRLIEVTEESFFEAIKRAKPGNHISDIGQVVQTIALRNGYSVVRNLTGHGIGTSLHEPPNIPNYKTLFKGARLRKGMTLAVEPMINLGNYSVKRLDDQWTFATEDGSLSAHYENTIAITDGACEILTMLPEEVEKRMGRTPGPEKDKKEEKKEEQIRIAEKGSKSEKKEKEEEKARIPEKESKSEKEEKKEEKGLTPEKESLTEKEEKKEEKVRTHEKESILEKEEKEKKEEKKIKEETVLQELALEPAMETKSSERRPKAPYQTLSDEEKRARRDQLFEDDSL